MKKVLSLFAMSIVIAFLFYSCAKESKETTPSVMSGTDIAAVKSLLQTVQNSVATADKPWIGMLEKNLGFESAQIADFTKDRQLVTIPIKIPVERNVDIKALAKTTPSTVSTLLVYKNKNGSIQLGNIVQFTPEGGQSVSGNTSALVAKFLNLSQGNTDYSGYFTSLSISKDVSYQMKFEKGRKTSNNIYAPKKKKSNGNTQVLENGIGDNCTDWYLVTTWYDENGNVIDQSEIYMTTTCFDPNGGGGSGPGGPDDPCVSEQLTNFSTECGSTVSASEELSSTVTSIDDFTKHKDPVWKIVRGGGGNWGLYSHEIGIIKLVDPANHVWAWSSLTHGGISIQGWALPGTNISFNQGFGTPSFTPEVAATSNIFYGGMNVSVALTFTFVASCPVVKDLVPPVYKTISNGHIWDANPL